MATEFHIRRLVRTSAGYVTIEVSVANNHAAVTLYDSEGWQECGEDTDWNEKDLFYSLLMVGVPRAEAEPLVREITQAVASHGSRSP